MNNTNKGRVIGLRAVITSAGTAVGRSEHEGPLGQCFDLHDPEDRFGQSTWEKAESEMQRIAFSMALKKAKLKTCDVGALFAGDLLNQCVGSAYGLLDFGIPYYGLYGACSTSAEGIMLASMAVNAGYFERAAAVTSSHNCSAERQYRTPIEYGGQKPPTAQWTVTGAGAFIISAPEADSECDQSSPFDACITAVMPGTVIDGGISDANNMGAAMAPAAADSLIKYFSTTGEDPSDFDLILTGDLGRVGSDMLEDLMLTEGYDISAVHNDCGKIIYKGIDRPDVNSGGSGCGCAAVVMAGYILPKLRSGELSRVLFLATGAMMSPSSIQQGLNIPSIGHIVVIEKHSCKRS